MGTTINDVSEHRSDAIVHVRPSTVSKFSTLPLYNPQNRIARLIIQMGLIQVGDHSPLSKRVFTQCLHCVIVPGRRVTLPPISSVFRGGGGHAAMPPPRKVRKHFLTRYTVKNCISTYIFCSKVHSKCRKCRFRDPKFQNGISNLYISLKSALKMQEMPFQRPKPYLIDIEPYLIDIDREPYLIDISIAFQAFFCITLFT